MIKTNLQKIKTMSTMGLQESVSCCLNYAFIHSLIHSFIHSAVCLTIDSLLLSKRLLHTVRSGDSLSISNILSCP